MRVYSHITIIFPSIDQEQQPSHYRPMTTSGDRREFKQITESQMNTAESQANPN
jgi:hypothetical protein